MEVKRMDASQAMRAMIEACGLTHKQLEARTGRYGGWVGQTLARPRPGADLLAEIARACGYRLELVPMDGAAESIAIGPDPAGAPGSSDSSGDEIAQARALLARASALLESMASADD
jgi:hypothetical protein